jgi:hypothetical protein
MGFVSASSFSKVLLVVDFVDPDSKMPRPRSLVAFKLEQTTAG